MEKTTQKKVLVPIIARAALLALALFIKEEIYGVRISLIIIIAILAWSVFDLAKRKKAKA